jgi:hypothetical protein
MLIGYRALCGIAILLLAAVLPTPAPAAFTQQNQFGTGTTIAMAWHDCNNDGRLDMAVAHSGQANKLYINNGDGTFTEQTQFGGGSTFAVLWGDFDNDGDADMAVGRNNQQSYLYINNGDGTYTQQSQFGLLRTVGIAWGDYDNDGDLDLAEGNGILGVAQQNYLYVNNGDGTFTQQAQFGQGQTDAVAWGDFDNDGDLDLAVGNGGFGYIGQNYLYINNGDGTFTERAEFGTGDTAALDWGDYNNDGYLDLAVGNWNDTQCMLYVNNGNGTFTGQPQFGNRKTNSIAWGDSNNDGLLDVAVGNGDFTSAEQNYLYLNNGDGTFTEEANFGLGSTDAVVWGDADGDGDLDLAAGNEHTPGVNYLFVNDRNDAHWLDLHLIGHYHDHGAGFSNRDAIGAKVSVYDAGYLGDRTHLRGYREIEAHGGFSSQSQTDPHFGLPGVSAVDVRITWPGSAHRRINQEIRGIAVGQRVVIDETGSPSGVPVEPITPIHGGLRITPNPTRGEATILLTEVGDPGPRTLTICDIAGRTVRVLNGAERFSWDGKGTNGTAVPAGVYLITTRHGATAGRVLVVR